jgi:DNA-damage-inducible protein J
MSATMVKKTTSVKLDQQAKEKAQKIFSQIGITMADAFNIFLHQVNLHKGLPFEVKIPNTLTAKVMEESLRGENIESFSMDEILELQKIRVNKSDDTEPTQAIQK